MAEKTNVDLVLFPCLQSKLLVRRHRAQWAHQVPLYSSPYCKWRAVDATLSHWWPYPSAGLLFDYCFQQSFSLVLPNRVSCHCNVSSTLVTETVVIAVAVKNCRKNVAPDHDSAFPFVVPLRLPLQMTIIHRPSVSWCNRCVARGCMWVDLQAAAGWACTWLVLAFSRVTVIKTILHKEDKPSPENQCTSFFLPCHQHVRSISINFYFIQAKLWILSLL